MFEVINARYINRATYLLIGWSCFRLGDWPCLANDVVKTLEKYKSRLMLADYKDAKPLASTKPDAFDRESIFDLGAGEIDFVGCHRVLKSIGFKGWLIVDLDIARNGPKASYRRSGRYIVTKLEPIYS